MRTQRVGKARNILEVSDSSIGRNIVQATKKKGEENCEPATENKNK